MQGEQGRVIPKDAAHFGERKIRFAPPTTANELLKRIIAEPYGQALATAPLHVGITQRTRDFTEYISVLDCSFDSDGLFWFLQTIAPFNLYRSGGRKSPLGKGQG